MESADGLFVVRADNLLLDVSGANLKCEDMKNIIIITSFPPTTTGISGHSARILSQAALRSLASTLFGA